EAAAWPEGETVLILASTALSPRLDWEEQAGHLLKAGYTRIQLGSQTLPLDPLPRLPARTRSVQLVIDRFTGQAGRLADSCEQAFRRGEGRLEIRRGERPAEKRSERWECAACGAASVSPEPALFSFNSPMGACP